MGSAIVIMGVSGSGKTENGQGNPTFRRRSPSMAGILRDAIRQKTSNGELVALACSALQKRYRDILRSADPDYKSGDYTRCIVKFFCLVAPVEVIAERMNGRSEKEEHFMPVSLLRSQLELLQVDDSEGIPQIDSSMSLQSILDHILILIEDK
ncbi:hypothetical protein HPP92_002455 [Vanilla planifolia]|uniref:gluconokinase n=1 Tax=Vanilla planifolia TaxID=51239 RepID=A0A835RTF9_VANPL|nr:hypothetical protein HPP92_002455 [Vanilla planifolia]